MADALEPIPDVAGSGLRLLLVGINPGRRSAELGRHFAGHGNRFWPALHAAGLTPEPLTPQRQDELVRFGLGITNLVARPTARASEVGLEELRAGARELERKVVRWQPRVVAFLGLGAYRTAFACPRARPGLQEQPLAGALRWLLPNPSGLNAHARPADHAAGLRAAGIAAGLLPPTRPGGQETAPRSR